MLIAQGYREWTTAIGTICRKLLQCCRDDGVQWGAHPRPLGWWSKSVKGSATAKMDKRLRMNHIQSHQKERTVSYVPKGSYHSDWDCELENLRQQVRELELKARSRCQRKSPEGSSHDHGSGSSYIGRSSHQSHSQLSKDRSTKSRDKNLVSPRREKDGHPNFAMNAISRALRKIVQSPFFEEIECTEMPRHFTRPPFTCYNGKTNTMEHVAILPNLWLSILGMMGYYAKCSLLVLTTR